MNGICLEWRQGVVLVADIHFPALLNAHPPLLDPRRKHGVQNTEPCRATFPPPFSSLPLFFSLSLLKHQLCFSWPLSLRARCPGIQRERSSRYLWKKRRETERKRGRANCPSAPFIREGVRSARRHNGIKGEELEKRATDCVFPLFVSVGWPYLSRDCRSGMKRYPGRTMRTSLY